MNIISKDGIAVYKFEGDVQLPSAGMIEITDNAPAHPIRIGGGDINVDNSILYNDVADIPQDYIGGKYLYDGTWTLNPDYEEDDA